MQLRKHQDYLDRTDIHWVRATVAQRVCNLMRSRVPLRDHCDENGALESLAKSTALDGCQQAASSR